MNCSLCFTKTFGIWSLPTSSVSCPATLLLICWYCNTMFCSLFFRHFKANHVLGPLNLLFPLLGMIFTHLLAYHSSGLKSRHFFRVAVFECLSHVNHHPAPVILTSPLYYICHGSHCQWLQLLCSSLGHLTYCPPSPPQWRLNGGQESFRSLSGCSTMPQTVSNVY